jgi:hypothetical protein
VVEHSDVIDRKAKDRRRIWVAMSLSTFCLLSIGLWWIFYTKDENDGGSTPSPSTERLLRAHFSLFRTLPESLPGGVRRILEQQHVALRTDLAQRLPIRDLQRYWVVPGNHKLCILAGINSYSFGTVCTPALHLLERGVAITFLSRKVDGGRKIVGIAPDSARQAVLRSRHRIDFAEVHNNLFTHRDRARIAVDRIILR